MKFDQTEVFSPITITLETMEEAVAFYTLVQFSVRGGELNTDAAKLAGKLNKWLSEEADYD